MLSTQFLPAERLGPVEICEQYKKILAFPSLDTILNSVPNVVLVLNSKRQIVYANNRLSSLLVAESFDDIMGLRPGELLGCMHASESEGGCGTTEFCKTCGAARAILSSINSHAAVQECRILKKDNSGALDLRVWATPVEVSGELYTIFSMLDIQDEKRRRVLERLFFHDILNAAGGIKGILDLMKEEGDFNSELFSMLPALAGTLIDEIDSYRTLSAAESNEINIQVSSMNSLEFLSNMINLYQNHMVGESKTLRMAENITAFTISTDMVLLKRVAGNMIKNALEATKAGGTVLVGCNLEESEFEIWVKNSGFIPRDLQLQMFQRSFSTKGNDRGLGTYSMKLFTEKYLKGKISFTSSEEDGTVFIASFPRASEEE